MNFSDKASPPSRHSRHAWLVRAILLMATIVFFNSSLQAAEPVEFSFRVAPSNQNPFSRELWAEVVLPSGRTLNLPAFYVGKDRFAVRARTEDIGVYALGQITEGSSEARVTAKFVGPSKIKIRNPAARAAIKINPAQPSRFCFTDGQQFVPIGANLAWAEGHREQFYDKAFEAFGQLGINWARVWMAHWSGQNLDWLPKEMGPSPTDGSLDLRVAALWDKIVAAAEARGVYLQLVLQHHGQVSSTVNSNWKDNPWNIANPGGFLASPVDFFTSSEAIRRTKQKYRTIIARWGYSPAIMAWELFNEVHWVDAMRGETKNEAAVALWHAEMAAYIRSIDRYQHLVTTSTENIASPIYSAMDYLQPHLYAPNLLAGPRLPPLKIAGDNRPLFFGEIGDDNLVVTDEVKKSGITIMPPVWAGLTGSTSQPAQAWLGAQLLETKRLAELGAIAKFLTATKLLQREGLTPFSPVLECADRVPLVFIGGQLWQHRPPIEIDLPLDGHESIELASIPRIYVGAKESVDEGYSSRATFRIALPCPTIFRFHITARNSAAGSIRIHIDGALAAERSWPEHNPDISPGAPPLPETIDVPISSGAHTLLIENPGSPGWFDLSLIETGLEVSTLAAMGQRGSDFVFAWVWHRSGVFSLKETQPVRGEIVLEAVTAGTWRVTWWNTLTGTPEPTSILKHVGGALRIKTPLVSRHAAVVLTRLPD
ncbi:MAG: cellulase family glycosylhydrolase [Verrucomicrobia bacterium]|nr:cellulase family glycosylhydrolase [Verrucomicrobiota bacterium]